MRATMNTSLLMALKEMFLQAFNNFVPGIIKILSNLDDCDPKIVDTIKKNL